jgi:hypothetical protein
MKKFIFGAMILFLALGLTGCKKKPVLGKASPEKAQQFDLKLMSEKFGQDFRWYETDIVLKYFLDDEKQDGTWTELSNIFQVAEDGDPHVYFIDHSGDSWIMNDKKGFWIEDYPINPDSLKISYQKAYEIMMASNYKKPHSKHCILRNPIGPLECNPQWVFGNVRSQIWIDATTGKATNSCPAFPADLNMPLGEWP